MADANATFGYGFEIPKKLLDKQTDYEDLIKDDLDLEFGFGGDEYYSKSGLKTFLLYKKSIESIYTWAGGAKQIIASNIPNDTWDNKLKTWAKKHKVSKPKLGWYLLVSMD